MMQCTECKREVDMLREPMPMQVSGLPDVAIVGVERLTCPACGATSELWPAPARLYAELTLALTTKPRRLHPTEWRWLRSRITRLAQDAAAMLGVSVGIVSKWENGKKPIPPQSDRLIRTLALLSEQQLARSLSMKLPAVDLVALVKNIDSTDDSPLTLQLTWTAPRWTVVHAPQAHAA